MIGKTNAISVSGGENKLISPLDDVCFYGADGELKNTMTKDEFLALTALPELPQIDADGVVPDGWGYNTNAIDSLPSLAELKGYVSDTGMLDLVAIYNFTKPTELDIQVVNDQKTIYLHIPTGNSSSTPVNITVNWGDGTLDEVLSCYSGHYSFPHTYSDNGNYTIVLKSRSASSTTALNKISIPYISYFANESASGSYVAGTDNLLALRLSTDEKFTWTNAYYIINDSNLKYIIYDKTKNKNGLFYALTLNKLNHVCLTRWVFPANQSYVKSSITFADTQALYNNSGYQANVIRMCLHTDTYGVDVGDGSALTQLAIPSNWSRSIASYFRSLYKIKTLKIPANATYTGQIGRGWVSLEKLDGVGASFASALASGYCFQQNYVLQEITIPSNVNSIGNQCFYNCGYALSKIVFEPTTPPTLGTNCFTQLNPNCKIYVPAGTLSAYTSAANYPSSSTYQYIEY